MTDVYLPGGIKEDGDAVALRVSNDCCVLAKLTPEYEAELIAKIVKALKRRDDDS